MQNWIKTGLAASGFAALAFAAAIWGPAPAAADSGAFSDDQVKSIESIVKNYLLNHPEILVQVQEAYERKAEAARADATRAQLPVFYKALDRLKPELAAMTAGTGETTTVIEFFDYNCGYCRRTLPDIVKLLETDPGVKVQFLEYPILAAESREAAKVALAASKQGKYFEFHKAMFAAGRATKDSSFKVAEQLGLDMAKLKADAAAPETEALLNQIADLGKQLMVDGTPTFIIGDKVNPGWTQLDQLKEFVATARKEGCKSCEAAAGK